MATKEINSKASGNNSIEKSAWKSIADTEKQTKKLCKTLPKQVSIP